MVSPRYWCRLSSPCFRLRRHRFTRWSAIDDRAFIHRTLAAVELTDRFWLSADAQTICDKVFRTSRYSTALSPKMAGSFITHGLAKKHLADPWIPDCQLIEGWR
jgi:hypothetical protein